MIQKIAFCGYAAAGKSEAAKVLVASGWQDHSFGTIIKRRLDGLVKETFGFSAFTENREQKVKIRTLLEQMGECAYDIIFDEYFATMPPRAVNARLVRIKEAEAWKAIGGRIVLIERDHVCAATPWEHDMLSALIESSLIDHTIANNTSIDDLHVAVVGYALTLP